MIALFGVVAASAAPAPQHIDTNPCEYFGMKKEWCVDGHFHPDLMAHLGDSYIDRHAPGTKRDDFMKGYEWPDGYMAAHDKAEFDKRTISNIPDREI